MADWKGRSPLEDALLSVVSNDLTPTERSLKVAHAVAIKYQREYKHVIYYTIKFLAQCDSNEKLCVIYFMDYTARYYNKQASDLSRKILARFADKLNDAFVHFKKESTDVKKKLAKVWTAWKTRNIFPTSTLDKVARTCDLFALPPKAQTNVNSVLDVLNAPAGIPPQGGRPALGGYPSSGASAPSGPPPTQQMYNQYPPNSNYAQQPHGAYGQQQHVLPPQQGMSQQPAGPPPSMGGPPPPPQSQYNNGTPSASNGHGRSRWGDATGTSGGQSGSTPSGSGANNSMIGRKRPRDSDDEEQPPGKLFLGGIHNEATDDEVRQYCEAYGPLESFFLVGNGMGGHKGFGFATFTEGHYADKMVQASLSQQHMIRGRKMDVKKCQKRSEVVPNSQRPKKPCFSWAKGMCRNGDACQYSHDAPQGVPTARPKNPCFNWAKGHCRNGDDCRYSHDAAQGSGPTGPTPGSRDNTNPYQQQPGSVGGGGGGGYGAIQNNGSGGSVDSAYTAHHKITGSNRAPMAFRRSFGPKTTDTPTAGAGSHDGSSSTSNSSSSMPREGQHMYTRPAPLPTAYAAAAAPQPMHVHTAPPPSAASLPPSAAAVALPPSVPVPKAAPAPPTFKAKVAKKTSIFKKKGGKKKAKIDAGAAFEL
jgi:hypothetical protein